MKKRRILGIMLVIVMIAVLVAACGPTENQTVAPPPTGGDQPAPGGNGTTPTPPPPTPAEDRPYGGVMRFVTTAEGANPIGVPWEVFGVDNALMIPTIETLVTESTTGDLAPWLAESWSIYDNEIIFTLRQGIQFSDGTPFNAESAAWNLQHNLEHNNLAVPVTAVEVRGEYEVALIYDFFTITVLSGLASRPTGFISPTAFYANGIEWARDNPVGTGPFVATDFVRGSHVTFERNPNYWVEGRPFLDGMVIKLIRDVMMQNVAMQASGEDSIDVLNTTNGEQVAMFREMGGFIASSVPIGPMVLAPSSLNPDSPFAILEVRQAVSYAINREAITAARGFGVLTPATQSIPEQFPHARLPASYNLSFNLERARELMEEAGFADGFTTRLIAQPGLADRDAAVIIQAMLAEININAELEFPDGGGYSAIRTGGWEGLLIQHGRTLTQVVSSFNFYFGNSINLLSSMWWPDYMEGMIEAAMAATDPDDQSRYLIDMHRVVTDQMLWMPLYNLYDNWIAKDFIRGAEFGQWGSGTFFLPPEIYIAP